MKKADRIQTAFAGVLLTVGLLVLLFDGDTRFAISTFIMAGITMLVGVIGKIQERCVRRSEKVISASCRINLDRLQINDMDQILDGLKRQWEIQKLSSGGSEAPYYSLRRNERVHYVSVFLDADNQPRPLEVHEDLGHQDVSGTRVSISGIQIAYSDQRVWMRGSDFEENLSRFIDLCTKIERRLPTAHGGVMQITVWQHIGPDTVYRLRFKRHLNSLLTKQYSHQITLRSEHEECKFGKDHASFRMPLMTADKRISDIAWIIW